jgi:hypothetical protein
MPHAPWNPTTRLFGTISPPLAALAAALWLGACAPSPAPPKLPPPEARSWIHEDDTSPVARPRVEVLGLQEEVSPDGAIVTLTGSLVNRGQAPTVELVVKVDALDEAGHVLITARATPASERIAAGGTVAFTATMENRPDTRNYHVEAIAR